MRANAPLLIVILVCLAGILNAQDSSSVYSRITNFPNKLFGRIRDKTDDLNRRLNKETEKYLKKLSKQDAKLQKRISAFDSSSSKSLFANKEANSYTQWLRKLKADTVAGKVKMPFQGQYYPYVDSLQTSMMFLKQNPQLLNPSKVSTGDLKASCDKLQLLQLKMQRADEIKQLVQQRREQLKQYISKYTHLPSGITNAYNDYNKQLYYYKQQLDDYKEILDNPDKMVESALLLLNRVPSFANFMKKNSILASLFPLPGSYQPSKLNQGMPTRDQVVAAFQNQVGKGGSDLSSVAQQNAQSVQGNLTKLTDKLSALRSGGTELDMPNFVGNSQKTKSFLKRIEYGGNVQTTQGSYYFPTTSDIAISVGYKLKDGNRIGVGASYKLGWGQDIGHIKISSQGVGLRSYIDSKLKGNLYISGGFEYNYQEPFNSLSEIKYLKSWQQSGLIGLSKIIPLKTKVLKATRLQLLWDFLSYQQIPKSQPFKFRVGYSF